MYRACTGIIPLRDLPYIDDPRGHASEKAMMIAISFGASLRSPVIAMMSAIERGAGLALFLLIDRVLLRGARRRARAQARAR